MTAIADNELPELDRGVDDEENEMLRAELDAISGEIQLRVDRIQELKECRTELHCSKVEKVYSWVLSRFQSSEWICTLSRPPCCSDGCCQVFVQIFCQASHAIYPFSVFYIHLLRPSQYNILAYVVF